MISEKSTSIMLEVGKDASTISFLQWQKKEGIRKSSPEKIERVKNVLYIKAFAY